MSSAELRKAAQSLRFDAWTDADPFIDPDVIALALDGEGNHVDLKPVIADWLEQSADRIDRGHHSGSRHAHRLARLINDGA